MKPKYLISLIAVTIAAQPGFAGNAGGGFGGQPSVGVGTGMGMGMGMGAGVGVPGVSMPQAGFNPYQLNPYTNPYGTPYGNPYANPYANPYNSPYASPYFGYGNGFQSGYYGGGGFGAPRLINGNTYSFNVSGAPLNFWHAPSGYYYPWMGGFHYNTYPIFVYNGGSGGAAQTLPPLSTIFSDLNDYLDKAKKDGKVDQTEYEHLKRRAADLLSKENSLAYESGGTIDPSQEAEIRRDVEGLSAEVARSVRP
jgi:hypothetical protein